MQPQPLQDEATRQRRLDSMKRRATMLLVAATVIFIVTRILEPRYGWIGIVRATAEAAMVGGLADWFAVTALFRHPLGIPIPHTAIVPTRKDRVGRTLGNFVQKNFLTREVIAGRLRSVQVGLRLAEWVSRPENAHTIAHHAAAALASASQLVSDEDVEAFIDRSVEQRVRSMRAAPLLGRLLSVVTAGNRHQTLLDEALRLTSSAVDDSRTLIRTRVEEETPWWVPSAIDEKIYRKIVGAVQRTLIDVRDDPAHPLRSRFDAALRRFIDELNHSPDVAARVEALKEEILLSDATRRFSTSLWGQAKAALQRYAENPDGMAPGTIERALTSFGEAVLADPALLQRLDAFVEDIAMFIVERYQSEVADLISHTVSSWDPEVTTQRVELAIGRDLQFIRINGTIVGGLAGMVIYLLSRLIP
ncbi:MAG TPA: DUF445 domain-containing protein [Gemmatimonadaceae bacterium]|nr:DUF445 domain-containing protein [Gemmatimonadaceae bacterium]